MSVRHFALYYVYIINKTKKTLDPVRTSDKEDPDLNLKFIINKNIY